MNKNAAPIKRFYGDCIIHYMRTSGILFISKCNNWRIICFSNFGFFVIWLLSRMHARFDIWSKWLGENVMSPCCVVRQHFEFNTWLRGRYNITVGAIRAKMAEKWCISSNILNFRISCHQMWHFLDLLSINILCRVADLEIFEETFSGTEL